MKGFEKGERFKRVLPKVKMSEDPLKGALDSLVQNMEISVLRADMLRDTSSRKEKVANSVRNCNRTRGILDLKKILLEKNGI